MAPPSTVRPKPPGAGPDQTIAAPSLPSAVPEPTADDVVKDPVVDDAVNDPIIDDVIKDLEVKELSKESELNNDVMDPVGDGAIKDPVIDKAAAETATRGLDGPANADKQEKAENSVQPKSGNVTASTPANEVVSTTATSDSAQMAVSQASTAPTANDSPEAANEEIVVEPSCQPTVAVETKVEEQTVPILNEDPKILTTPESGALVTTILSTSEVQASQSEADPLPADSASNGDANITKDQTIAIDSNKDPAGPPVKESTPKLGVQAATPVRNEVLKKEANSGNSPACMPARKEWNLKGPVTETMTEAARLLFNCVTGVLNNSYSEERFAEHDCDVATHEWLDDNNANTINGDSAPVSRAFNALAAAIAAGAVPLPGLTTLLQIHNRLEANNDHQATKPSTKLLGALATRFDWVTAQLVADKVPASQWGVLVKLSKELESDGNGEAGNRLLQAIRARSCPLCGVRTKPCPGCAGSGISTKTCGVCSGTGYSSGAKDPSGRRPTCMKCKGRKVTTGGECDQCHGGKKKLTCETCKD